MQTWWVEGGSEVFMYGITIKIYSRQSSISGLLRGASVYNVFVHLSSPANWSVHPWVKHKLEIEGVWKNTKCMSTSMTLYFGLTTVYLSIYKWVVPAITYVYTAFLFLSIFIRTYCVVCTHWRFHQTLYFIFIPTCSQLQWKQYVDHYCRDFPCLFTKQIVTNDNIPMDEGELMVVCVRRCM